MGFLFSFFNSKGTDIYYWVIQYVPALNKHFIQTLDLNKKKSNKLNIFALCVYASCKFLCLKLPFNLLKPSLWISSVGWIQEKKAFLLDEYERYYVKRWERVGWAFNVTWMLGAPHKLAFQRRRQRLISMCAQVKLPSAGENVSYSPAFSFIVSSWGQQHRTQWGTEVKRSRVFRSTVHISNTRYHS